VLVAHTRTESAQSAELKVLALGAMAPTLRQLLPEFERSSGLATSAWFGPPAVIREKLITGEYADVVFTAAPSWDELLQARKIQNGLDIAKSGVGVGVRKGAMKPDLRTGEGLKAALLRARSIGGGRFDNGSVGTQTLLGFQKLGIVDQILPKYRFYLTGAALIQALADREIEMGLSVIADMAASKDIDYAGPFPPGIQEYILIRAAVTIGSFNPNGAQTLIEFVRRPARAEFFRAYWLEPVI